MKPSGQHSLWRQRSRLPGEVKKNGLGDFLGQSVFATHTPQGNRVNQRNMALDQFLERSFTAAFRISSKPVSITIHSSIL
jgi:hypothetical protein